tara:strand:+ start:1210 stop:2517 length:1308 start_codon:yes stop_codon:yes gene_type:complete
MKKINSVNFNKTKLKSTGDFLKCIISGEDNAVFSLQIKDSSTPNKFYNFKTKTFTNTFSSENTLSNEIIFGGSFEVSVKIPAASNGAEYKFLVLADPFFDTETVGQNSFLLTRNITQESDVTVRFSTSSDQSALNTPNYVGLGTFVSSTSGSANQPSSNAMTITDYELKDSNGVFHGYKFDFNVRSNTMFVSDSLQPIDSDFFIKQTKETVGSGSSATLMVLNNVNNLVVGMSLASIESSDVTTTGSLGVLTFPTITAIDVDNKTVTLSSAHSWSTAKDVEFRAYGSDLIRQSTDGAFQFNNFKVEPASRDAAVSSKIAEAKVKPFGFFLINGSMGSAGTTLTVDNVNGVSSGARIFGPGVDTGSNNNLISTVNALGTSIVVGGNQQLLDNTKIFVLGAAPFAFISGNITIATFPSVSTDIFFDIDRAIPISTLS